MPRFSLVIPTLRRADTFRHALATLLEQDHQDYEIVVQNNGRDAETEAVVDAIADPRVRHFASDSILPMTENWETALGHARGELITFIGDDDGLLPDACRLAAAIIDRSGVDILCWRPFCYYWPTYLHPELRNRLVAAVDHEFHVDIMSSEHQLGRFYRFAIDYSELPMIYNSFVQRSVVERVQARIGRYFLGTAPDVASGIVNAAHTGHYAVLSRPLSMTGLSHHSNGHTAFLSPRGYHASQIDQEIAELELDERLPPTNNLQLFLANEMLLVRDHIEPGRPVDLDFRRLIEFVAAAINDRPGFYQETLAAIKVLAKRHHVDLAEIVIPTLLDSRATLICGRYVVGPGQMRVVIDGDRIPLRTIADAVRLMAQFVPALEDAGKIGIRQVRGGDRAQLRLGETIAFGADGNGLTGLGDGWSEPEAWGTWSISKRASLRLLIEPVPAKNLCAELTYRSFLPSARPRLEIACRAAGRNLGAWQGISSSVQRIAIPSDVISPDGALDLEFLISDPQSPAELGISADTRHLGLGIETLRLNGADTG